MKRPTLKDIELEIMRASFLCAKNREIIVFKGENKNNIKTKDVKKILKELGYKIRNYSDTEIIALAKVNGKKVTVEIRIEKGKIKGYVLPI